MTLCKDKTFMAVATCKIRQQLMKIFRTCGTNSLVFGHISLENILNLTFDLEMTLRSHDTVKG